MFIEAVLVLFGVVLSYILLKYFLHLLSLRHYPKGPFPIPLLGNLNLVRGQRPYVAMKNLAKEYGDVYGFSLGKLKGLCTI